MRTLVEPANGTKKWRMPRRALIALLAVVGLGAAVTPVGATDVLILGPTVPTAMNSLEYKIITTTGPVPGFPTVTGLGMSATIATASQWPSENYANYKAIVLGDPACSFDPGPGGPIAAAEANASIWSAAVTGNVVIIGTDPSFPLHQSLDGGAQLWKWAISFAAAGPGTGAAISLSCYYDSPPPSKPVPVLSGFGIFMAQEAECANTAAIVATSPALTGLTSTVLSNWDCSAHEGFTVWPPNFMPLAVVTDTTVPHNFTAADGTTGFPYILARGVTPIGGILKVCKVAGTGIKVGTPFNVTISTSTSHGVLSVPAGPAPGGTCMIGPTYPVGTQVAVTETPIPGNIVSSIGVAPPGQLVSTNLAGGGATVIIGSGVTEVTFTDQRTGFLEICKAGRATGDFRFTVDPGALGPFVVPAGACSPAIEVAAGPVTITELPTRGAVMADCSTIPASQQGLCTPPTSKVTVVPGDVSTMTIAIVTNRPIIFPIDGAATIGHTHGTGRTGMTLACAPNPAPLRVAVTCTAKVTAVDPKTGTPSGAIRFFEGDTTLATIQLGADGTAAFTTSTLAAGPHAILATYGGNANFGQSVSQQVNLTVEQPR